MGRICYNEKGDYGMLDTLIFSNNLCVYACLRGAYRPHKRRLFNTVSHDLLQILS